MGDGISDNPGFVCCGPGDVCDGCKKVRLTTSIQFEGTWMELCADCLRARPDIQAALNAAMDLG